jgi:hypothetical protein
MRKYPVLKYHLWVTTARVLGIIELSKDDVFKVGERPLGG